MTTKGQTYDGKVRNADRTSLRFLQQAGLYDYQCSLRSLLTCSGSAAADCRHLVMWSHAVRHAGGRLPV